MLIRLALISFWFAGPLMADFSVKDVPEEGHLDFLENGRLVGRYMYGRDKSSKARDFDTAKTYLHVFDAEGKALITKGAGGELPHHRGIFIGWNKLTVGGTADDLWHMKNSEQLHEGFSGIKSGAEGGEVTSKVIWKGKGGTVLIEEMRTMKFTKAPAPAYVAVDFRSTLTAVAGDVALKGDPEHAGLQFRPSDEVNRGKTDFLFPLANANPMKDVDYPWVLESCSIGEKRYQVVFLNHPANPKGTRFSAYRNYGRFGAFFVGDIPKGGAMTLQVKFLVREGDRPEVAWIQKEANAYRGEEAPVPEVTLKESKPKPAPVKK